MTPLQFAKMECANYLNGGGCEGVKPEDLIDSGQRKTVDPKDKCLLANSGERCRYFEEVVLPIADHPNPVNEPGLYSRYRQAREEYFIKAGLWINKQNKQRFCMCGALLAKRQRYCLKCAAKKRRETRKKSRNKKPVNYTHLTGTVK